MILGRTSAFLIYPCMSKTRLLEFKMLLRTGGIQDSSNLGKQLNNNTSHYQVCSAVMSSADSAAPQHVPLPADHHRSRTNTTRSCSPSHYSIPCCRHALSSLTSAEKEQLGQAASRVLWKSLSTCLTPRACLFIRYSSQSKSTL